MEKSAPYTVAQGTITTSALSAFVTGVYGIITSHPNYGVLAGAAAFNSGVTAATFFGLREYVVSPLLVSTLPFAQYERRRHELGYADTHCPSNSQPSISWSDKRAHKLLDSGLSGAATGGILRGWRSGPAAALPGALTVGAACIGLQYAFNEASIARLRYASRQSSKDEEASLTDTRLPLDHNIALLEPPSSFGDKVLGLLGVRKMDEVEYLEKMKKTRDRHLERIAELEKQLEVESRGDKN
ncbi:hypothetical protein M378DRAFT_98260 [Amanita muscaria Koide BX008]|uniref:Uncharacterized protein n=1 Tax=Amanita muscaria (strain Koide BX008) TaxID=946122 RepID=A0A0C2XLQ1_AMAMK|nr:hypothetical protein M378DRAFT_98260 [Amanita muscaria Koide BX008]